MTMNSYYYSTGFITPPPSLNNIQVIFCTPVFPEMQHLYSNRLDSYVTKQDKDIYPT